MRLSKITSSDFNLFTGPFRVLCKDKVWCYDSTAMLVISLSTFKTSLGVDENLMFILENMGNRTLSCDCSRICCWEFQASGWKSLARGRRALVSVTKASVHILPSLHQCACFDWATATRYAAPPYMAGTCHRPSVAGQWSWKKGEENMEAISRLFSSRRLSKALCRTLFSGP